MLDQLAIEHGADKSSIAHNYAVTYDKWFRLIKDLPVTILEIGVAGGCSLKMWDKYFTNPNTRIFGLDINKECLEVVKTCSSRVNVDIVNAADTFAMESWFAKISPSMLDIIIDDGSHTWKDQQITFFQLWPKVVAGGQYWIEDLHTSYWKSHSSTRYNPTIDFLKGLVDDVNMRGNPTEAFGCRADRKYSLTFASNDMEKTVEEVHFWKGLSLIKKQGT